MLTLGRRPVGAILLVGALLLFAGGSTPSATADTVPTVVAQRGDHSPTVTAIQKALIAAGITPAGGADGWYGPGTTAAVAEYQRRHGLPSTGIVERATATLLGVVPATPLLSLGSRGPEVATMQQQLLAIGVTVRGGADGVYGRYTAAAVKYFQQTRRVRPSGALDAGTAALLAAAQPATPTTETTIATETTATTATSSPTTAPTTAAPVTTVPVTTVPATPDLAPLAPGARGSEVASLQKLLITVGLTPRGGADGIYGASTTAMVRTFQTQMGLAATGIADPPTRRSLAAAVHALATPTAPTPTAIEASPAVAGHHGAVDLQYLPLPRTCAIRSSFGAPRSGGRRHQGIDMMVPRGTPIYAARAGTITKINVDYPGSLAGNAVYLTLPDGTYFFHAHLDRVAPGISRGSQVAAGALLGYVGSTGNARGPHLHLEIHPRGGIAVDPYPIIRSASGC
jgi:peptidoglycan hydrolase-like protein with peptidoglycan-binding domain